MVAHDLGRASGRPTAPRERTPRQNFENRQRKPGSQVTPGFEQHHLQIRDTWRTRPSHTRLATCDWNAWVWLA